MFQKVRLAILSLIIAVGGGIAVLPATAFAADSLTGDACAGLNTLNGKDGDTNCDAGSGDRLNGILRFTINIFSAVVGFVAVLMIIVNGLKFITANGDSSAVSSARSGILYALVGIIIVALSQVFVNFVLSRTTQCPYNKELRSSDTRCVAPRAKES